MALPQGFLDEARPMFDAWGMRGEWSAFLDSFADAPARAYRLNSLKFDAAAPPDEAALREAHEALLALARRAPYEQVFEVEARRVPWSAEGFYLPEGCQIGKLAAYRAGLYYIQEASAMLPAELLAARPGERVLDLCAAPGGKSARLAAALRGGGLLWSNDISEKRARVLLRNLEQLGVANAVVSVAEPAALSAALPGYFDRVLVDAPCSGEGMFRRDPQAAASWTAFGREALLPLQSALLEHAARLLRAGGEMVYSTCTFNRLENEAQIEAFLAGHPEFYAVDGRARLPSGEGLSPGLGEAAALRVWPQRARGDGHYACLLRKSACAADGAGKAAETESGAVGPPAAPLHPRKPRGTRAALPDAAFCAEARGAVLEFLGTVCSAAFVAELRALPERRWRLENGRIHLLPEACPDLCLPAVKLLKSGRFVAELKSLRQGMKVLPTHSFLLSLRARDLREGLRLDEEDERLRAYLSGATLALRAGEAGAARGAKGERWLPVLYRDHPLGWAKTDGGAVKNLYPPGWRD